MSAPELKSDAPCVEEFISQCVQFKGTTTFHSVENGKQFESVEGPKSILLLGSTTALQDVARVRSMFPYYSDSLGMAIRHAKEGSAQIAAVTMTSRIFVGKVPDTASRHNCKARPDVVYTIVKEAIRAAKPPTDAEMDIPLDIYYVGKEYSLAIAAAVARSNFHHFSAKSGNTDCGYARKQRPVRVVLEDFETTNARLESFVRLAEMVQLCQRMVDAPTNVLNSVTFADIASGWVKRLKDAGRSVSMDVIKGDDLRTQGYGGLYSTGKAAELPPHLITLSYEPTSTASKERVTFVGKGIVYDTGGLSLKSRDGMCTMKHDMGGAAAIFCSFIALALLEAPITLKCVLCVAENAIGPKAMRNDDIIRLKSGVTIEINNTDAEGRLVLSDGVFHATGVLETPSIVVDMATLTGAQGIATGKKHAAIFCNSDNGEDRLMRAGKLCGDLCFPIVYCPEFHNSEFSSEFADFRNSVKNRANAQASCAGQFIGNNLAKDYKGDWVHVDLASPATADEATGFGVALLVQAFSPDSFSPHP